MKIKGILWMMALFLFVQSGFYFSEADAADLKAMQRQRAVESKVPSQQIMAQPPIARVTATSTDPMSVQLELGKAAVTVTVKGSNLDKATQVEVVQAGQKVNGIESTMGAPSSSARQVTLKAAAGTAPGNYQVRITAGSQKIEIPLSLFRVEVKASAPPAAVKPQAVTGQMAKLPNKQTVSQTSTGTFKPVDIMTEKLTVAGKGFKPVDIATGKLTVAGKGAQPADNPAESSTDKSTSLANFVTTAKPTVAVTPPSVNKVEDVPKMFKPVDIITQKLTVAGKGFKPVDITTGKLTVAGAAK